MTSWSCGFLAGWSGPHGVALDVEPDGSPVLDESPSGALSFSLRGFLPDGRVPRLSALEVREVWRRLGPDELERWGYAFELLDHERGFRRAFHLHDVELFVRRFLVAVHEHCEQPIGHARCADAAGSPVRDGYQGVELLIGTWLEPSEPDCSTLICLE